MKEVRVLVFPCGSEIGLEIYNALKDIYFIELIGASSVPDHGRCVYKNYYEDIPFITEDHFIEKFNELVEKEKIDFIFPAMDEVIRVLAKNQHKLSAPVLTSDLTSVEVCCSKKQTYQVLKDKWFLPKVYNQVEEVDTYPVIIKPDRGYGAKGFLKVEDKEKLSYELQKRDFENVICEYLPGNEYTVDCFTDQHGKLRYASCRIRKRIRNGISVNSILQPPTDEIREIAESINETLSFRGAWFFQVKEDCNQKLKLLEVATRIAGTMCVQRAAGINLPLLTVFDAMGYEVDIDQQFDYVEVDRALENVYFINEKFTEIYVDFDDTLVIKNKVNLDLIKFLYQCTNEDIPLYLVTKHAKDIRASLKKYKIDEELFKEIIHIDKSLRKCDFIKPHKQALFIDDSFSERKEMKAQHGIKVIGVDAIEALLTR